MMLAICRLFPRVGIRSRSSRSMKAMGVEPERYMGMSIILSATVSLVLLVSLAMLEPGLAIPFSLLGFAGAFGLFLALPELGLRRRTAEIETEMPFFLRSLGILLEMGLPFERALGIASEGKGKLEEEMSIVRSNMGNGMSLQKAFSAFAASKPSLVIKRAASQLISAYESGSSGKEMKEIGDELLSIEQHRLKQHAARNAMFGLLFIISSAVFPTFFLVYSIIGRFAFGTGIDDSQIMLALLVMFPLISMMILMVSKASMPRSAFSAEKGFDARMLLPGAMFILGFVIVPQLNVFALIAGSALAVYLAYENHKREKGLEEIDNMLPDALFSVAGLPKSARPEMIFEALERGEFGELSKEAAKSRRQLAMNLKTDTVLDDLWQRNRSPMLRRACLMMKQMVHTNSLHRMGMLAEDMIRHFQTMRERSQTFALQKYTLMFGALLVPLIMNTALGLLDGMGGVLDDPSVAEAVSFSASVVPPYLVIYAMIASSAIADAEGRRSLAALYFLGMAGLSLVTFYFISF